MPNDVTPGLIYAALLEIKGDLGEVKSLCSENKDHTLAVSRKADAVRTELAAHATKDEAHYQDLEAHGRGSTIKLLLSIGGVVAGIEAAIQVGKAILK